MRKRFVFRDPMKIVARYMSPCASRRVKMSPVLPAGKPTIKRTACVG
jgi:hypothetical protein